MTASLTDFIENWYRRPKLRRILTGLLLTAIAFAVQMRETPVGAIDALDREQYDARLRWHREPADPRIVIVDIDEKSLARIGRWPWSRTTMARLIDRLTEHEAAAIGLDMVFAEPEAASSDARFAEAIAGRPVVLGYYFSSDRDGTTAGRLPAPVMSAEAVGAVERTITLWDGYGANLPVLQDKAQSAGFFNPLIDRDGVVRALPLLGIHGGQVYDSLAVALLRTYLGEARLHLTEDRLFVSGTRGHATFPLSAGVSALVPFSGIDADAVRRAPGSGRFRYLSAADVLEGGIEPGVLRGAIVVIGTATPGLTDLRATPVSEVFPGVEIHASLIAGALDGRLKQRPIEGPLLSAVVLMLVGIGLAFGLPYTGAVGVIAFSTLAVSALVAWNGIAYASLGLVLPMAASVLLVLALAVMNLGVGYLFEGRARRAMVDLFGEYVSPELVERMADDPQRYRNLRSENRELTILFADMRGFTRISESLEPEQLREYLNEVLTVLTEVVYRYGGTVDKYIGDCVMAFWGAPIDDPHHADNAVAAAMAMQEEVAALNRNFAGQRWPNVAIGIGINTGNVRVGDLGSRLRRAYTVIGDAVNVASRFEEVSKEFDVPIIVGETTVNSARRHVFSKLATVAVAGRVEPTSVFTPISGGVTLPMPQFFTDMPVQRRDTPHGERTVTLEDHRRKPPREKAGEPEHADTRTGV